MNEIFSIKDKVAVITGGAHGIGIAYAIGLLEQGAKVAVCDVNETFLSEAKETLAKFGEAVMIGCVDVTSPSQIDKFVQKTLRTFGSIDILVNNAGVLIRKFPEEMYEDNWDYVMDINVKGTFLFSTAVGRTMIAAKKKGKIINISSQAGYRAADRRLVYCTSKAAIIHFTKTLAHEWGKYGINVNAIAPGHIKTDMNEDLRSNVELYQGMKNEIPLGDFGMPEDIIGTLTYLSSSASDYVTGQTIAVDGGLITK